MTSRTEPRKGDPISSLTVGELEALIGRAIDERQDGSASDALTEVQDLRQRFDEFDDWLAGVVDFFMDVYEWWQGEQGPDAAALREHGRSRRLDRFARAYLLNRGSDGEPPTQEQLAEALGVSDRWLRMAGWSAIQERARELEAGPEAP